VGIIAQRVNWVTIGEEKFMRGEFGLPAKRENVLATLKTPNIF
jgi:hypothetical protein